MADLPDITVSVRFPKWQQWILAALAPFLLIGNLLIQGYLRLFRDIRISETDKCPACGVRVKHKIQYAEAYEMVIHQCTICQAAWGSRPVLPATRWKITRVDGEKTQASQTTPTP